VNHVVRIPPLTRAGTPDGRRCIAVLERLSLEALRSLNEATRETRSDDEYLTVFRKWMESRT
jgi:hypothetical protein